MKSYSTKFQHHSILILFILAFFLFIGNKLYAIVTEEDVICHPLLTSDLEIIIPDDLKFLHVEEVVDSIATQDSTLSSTPLKNSKYIESEADLNFIEVRLLDNIKASITLNNQVADSLTAFACLRLIPDDSLNTPDENIPQNPDDDNSEEDSNESEQDAPTTDDSQNEDQQHLDKEKIILLTPQITNSGRSCKLYLAEAITPGNWILEIPENYFEIIPEYINNIEDIDIDETDLLELSVAGAWRTVKPSATGRHYFSIHDDDGLDGLISPSTGSEWGYFSILYPMLESLGIKGNLSLEGRRAGFTSNPPQLNLNGKIARRLQDERGWEIMNHSMICLGEVLNNWKVDSINSALADSLLDVGPNYGINSRTVSIYDLQSRKQYQPNDDNSGWIESDPMYIKPYIGDYEIRKGVMFNPDYDVAYHWGKWFEIAEEFGIHGKSYVAHNSSSSHALAPLIQEFSSNAFSDLSSKLFNEAPLMSTATRMVLEGQAFYGYNVGDSPDNTFNYELFDLMKRQIDLAVEKDGWLVFGIHTYRPCWRNYLPGALVSEGGDYPDEWVMPMTGIDFLNDPLTPPERLGIESWAEWYPCPGTRLDMAWQLLKYAQDKGMINVTSSEGFDLMRNTTHIGYFNDGHYIGQDAGTGLYDTKKYYPHYVVGNNGVKDYYNTLLTEPISYRFETIVENKNDEDVMTFVNIIEKDSVASPHYIIAYSIDGIARQVSDKKELPKGLWILDGKKIVIR